MEKIKNVLAVVAVATVTVLFFGFFVWAVIQPTYYHAKCYSAGNVIFDEDIAIKGFGVTYLLNDARVTLPSDGCILVRK